MYIFVHFSTIASMNLNFRFPSNSVKNPMSSLPSLTLTLTNNVKISYQIFKQNFSTIRPSIIIMKFFAFQNKKEMSVLLLLPINKTVNTQNKSPYKAFFLWMMNGLLNAKNQLFSCLPGFILGKVLLLMRLREL